MAELGVEERLQPSLLDRLTDSEPDSKVESRAQRVLSVSRLKRSVMRDVEWLLNTGNLSVTDDLSDYQHVERSVLNYGIGSLAGTTVSAIDVPALERRIRQTLLVFEPRLLADSLNVRVVVDDKKMSLKRVALLIEGRLWAQPLPISLCLSTDLDLETGTVSVAESSR